MLWIRASDTYKMPRVYFDLTCKWKCIFACLYSAQKANNDEISRSYLFWRTWNSSRHFAFQPCGRLFAKAKIVCKYYYYPGWHEPGTCLEAFINLKYWNKLDNNLKKLVSTCCAKSNSSIAAEFFIRNSFAIKKLKDDYNVNFKKYPKDLLIKLKKQSDEITQNLASQDPKGTQILDNILKHREIFMFWSNYSEKSFLESRL